MKTGVSVSRNDGIIVEALLKSMIYFNLFSHPLTLSELVEYCSVPGLTQEHALRLVRILEQENIVRSYTGFYLLNNDRSIVLQRLKSNCLATLRYPKAVKYSRLIANFPFVRAVFISGSLSKNVMHPDDDIDFFIVTKPGRLWLCRALLTFFKKTFLGNSHRNFCINYFIDLNSLEIQEKNIYTSTEVMFLLPMYNYELYLKFLEANKWCITDYPNFPIRKQKILIRTGKLKEILEALFNNRLGDWLESKSFKIIPAYWKKKFAWMSKEQFATGFLSLVNISKHHPDSYQLWVLNSFNEKWQKMKTSAEMYGFLAEQDLSVRH